MKKNCGRLYIFLTKYEAGAKTNPPKKPRSPPKKGNVTPMNNVNTAYTETCNC